MVLGFLGGGDFSDPEVADLIRAGKN